MITFARLAPYYSFDVCAAVIELYSRCMYTCIRGLHRILLNPIYSIEERNKMPYHAETHELNRIDSGDHRYTQGMKLSRTRA